MIALVYKKFKKLQQNHIFISMNLKINWFEKLLKVIQ